MDKDELLERYEALGQESDFLAARPLFEAELRERDQHGQPDAELLRQYGYLLQCHGRIAIRQAIEAYERSMAVNPDDDQVRYMWIGAKAELEEDDHAVRLYRERVAAAPGDVRELRFLARAYLAARDFDAAREVIEDGLTLAPDDDALISDRAEVKAVRGDPEGALADWRRALELNPENLGPVYHSAFLLEREGRLPAAVESWQYIIDYCDARGWELTAAWPRKELQRLRELLARSPEPGQ